MDRRGPMASRGSYGASAVRRIRAGGRVTAARHAFPSPEWVAAYGAAINASEDYRTASTEWTHGSVALVMPAQPAIGVPDDVGIWLDLDRGVCRGARLVTRLDAQHAPFIDRKSTRLNSSHSSISYAVFCLKKKNINT